MVTDDEVDSELELEEDEVVVTVTGASRMAVPTAAQGLLVNVVDKV